MRPGSKHLLWGMPAIVLATFVAYSPALRAGFVWDDDSYVTQNPLLRTADGLRRIWLEPGSHPQYYPLVHTTFWIEYRLWGLDPAGFHAANIALHALNAVLLWLILRRLAVPGAFLAALIFALHPVHVESVAWVTERKNVLSGLLYLAAFAAWLRFSPPDRDEGRGRTWYLFSLGLFLGALFSKTVTCTLPAAILLVGWWKRGRVSGRDAVRLVPFLVAGVALGLVTVRMEVASVGAKGEAWGFSWVERILIAGRALWFYAGKLLWPRGLAFNYPRWTVGPSAPLGYVFPAAALAAVLALWGLRERIGRGPLTAVLFFAGTLAPALGFFDVYPMKFSFVADHYAYLASIGLIALFAAALARYTEGVPAGGRAVAAAALVAAAGLACWGRAHAFRDGETLWRDTLAKNPGSWLAANNLGLDLVYRGRPDEAVGLLEHALRAKPDYDAARYNLGLAWAGKGDLDRAVANIAEAQRMNPGLREADFVLGLLLARQGKTDEAIERYLAAERGKPRSAAVAYALAAALHGRGRVAEAVPRYLRAVELEPRNYVAMNNLAWILATYPDERVRDAARAVAMAERAFVLTEGRLPRVWNTLAAAYAEAGRFEGACAAAERAAELAAQSGDAALAAETRPQIEAYRRGEAWRESGRAPASPGFTPGSGPVTIGTSGDGP